MDRPRALIDALDGAERHEDALPRGKKAPRRGEKPGHRPALLLDAEVGSAPDLAVGRLDAIAEHFRAAARKLAELRKAGKVERMLVAPIRTPTLC